MLTTISAILAIIIAVITLIVQLTAIGIYIGKLEGFKELVNYRFDKQDSRLDKHNNFITRMYDIEKKEAVLEEQMDVANHRIADLEKA